MFFVSWIKSWWRKRTARLLPKLPDPADHHEWEWLQNLRRYTNWGQMRLERITFPELIKGLWELYDGHGEHFPGPETSVLLARAVAWEVIKPCMFDGQRALQLAVQYDTAIQLSFPMEMLDKNLRGLTIDSDELLPESGQALAEYGVIIAVIAVAAIAGILGRTEGVPWLIDQF